VSPDAREVDRDLLRNPNGADIPFDISRYLLGNPLARQRAEVAMSRTTPDCRQRTTNGWTITVCVAWWRRHATASGNRLASRTERALATNTAAMCRRRSGCCKSGAAVEAIAAYLDNVAVDGMGLSPNSQHAPKDARLLIKWRD